MGIKFSNNAATTLSAGINDSVTSIAVADASEFPDVSGAADYMYLTLANISNIEVIKVTSVAGTTLTAVRAQDGTSPSAFSLGDACELRVTAGVLTDALTERQAASAALDAVSGSNTGDEVAATVTVPGIVELSTSSENVAGTATTSPTVAGVKEMITTHGSGSPIPLILALG
tara:strand:- start:268 stop:786 length:519 start_codon:yes stop_codon:yes gene_type:complete